MLNFTYPPTAPPKLLRQLLKEKGVSLTLWRKIKRLGNILVNDAPHPLWVPIQGGDRISITWPENQTMQPLDRPLHIIYEDDSLLVVDKPAGIPVHPTQYHPSYTLANSILYHYQKHNLNIGFHPVHRLDRNTSGLILIAKTPIVQHLLSLNLHKNFNRTYLAMAEGTFDTKQGSINAPISRSPDSIIKRMVNFQGQQAITNYIVLETFVGYSLLKITLDTGRTHQIRVHMSYIGHPLLGDDLYGGSTQLINRQALHASELTFYHPTLQQTIHLTSPLPEDFQALLKH